MNSCVTLFSIKIPFTVIKYNISTRSIKSINLNEIMRILIRLIIYYTEYIIFRILNSLSKFINLLYKISYAKFQL